MFSWWNKCFFPVRWQFSWCFFQKCISFHRLHILFLEPLHSARDRHPYQRTCSHSPTYDLRSCCYIFFYLCIYWNYFVNQKKVLLRSIRQKWIINLIAYELKKIIYKLCCLHKVSLTKMIPFFSALITVANLSCDVSFTDMIINIIAWWTTNCKQVLDSLSQGSD